MPFKQPRTCPGTASPIPPRAWRKWTLVALSSVLLAACDSGTPQTESTSKPSPAAAATGEPALPAAATTEEKVLNFSNWPDYIPEGLIAKFEKETGIKVNYKTFKTNEELMDRLSSDKTNDDLVVPSSTFAALQIDKGLLKPLDKSRLPNLANMDPDSMGALSSVDPQNRHLVPWAWGFTTVGINATKAAKALGNTPMPGNAWELVFNPVYTSKLKSCGIAFLDSPTEVMPAALHYIGKPANSVLPADLKAAGDMLAQVRPHVQSFSNTLISELASGNVCVVLGWNGDINAAKTEASDAGSKDRIEVLMPSTGGMLFIDTLAIPASAPHPQNAHAFIDFFMRPENAAQLTNELAYPTGNKAAGTAIEPDILKDETIFPNADAMQRMVAPPKLDLMARLAMTQAYLGFAYGLKTAEKKASTP